MTRRDARRRRDRGRGRGGAWELGGVRTGGHRQERVEGKDTLRVPRLDSSLVDPLSLGKIMVRSRVKRCLHFCQGT